MSKSSQPTSIRLDPETKRELRAWAEPRGWKLAQLIQHILREWLKYQKKQRGKL